MARKNMERMDKVRHARRVRVRTLVQVVMALFVFSMVFVRYAAETGMAVPALWPDLQGICPVAMAQTLGGLLVGDLPAADRSNLWMLVGALALAAVGGALFCGWLCPLGSVQDWFGRIGRRLFGRRYNRFVPHRLDRVLGYARYLLFALVVVQSVRFVGFAAATLNPARALMHVWTGGAFTAGLVVLALTLIGALFVERPWCRWLCPFGAVQGTVARISPWTIRRDAHACVACGKCSRVCPMGVSVDTVTAVRDGRCNRCTICVAACPVPRVLDYSSRGPRAAGAVSLAGGAAAAALALALFFLPVGLARATGAYAPAGRAGQAIAATLVPAEISPTMTLAEVAKGLGLSGSQLLAELGIDEAFDTGTRIFDIEEDQRYEHITVGWVRRVLSDDGTE